MRAACLIGEPGREDRGVIMAAHRILLLGFVLVALCFVEAASGAECPPLFEKVDKTDPSNAAQGVRANVPIREFLQQLFQMSLSEDLVERKFGGVNIADIAAGSLIYSQEYRLTEADWNAIVDSFLIEGYLQTDNEVDRQGYALLIWQRPTNLAKLVRKRCEILKPKLMDRE